MEMKVEMEMETVHVLLKDLPAWKKPYSGRLIMD
jgi:hypothetical protein